MFFSSIPSIKATEAAKKVKDTGALFIDVRTPAEYRSGHAKGAVNYPLQDLDTAIDQLRNYESVYVICQSGGRSSTAVSHLRSAKINAINVAGGTLSWRAEGLPMQ